MSNKQAKKKFDKLPKPAPGNGKGLHIILITAFAFLLYANTLSHDFAQDDAIVITDNMFTVEGVSGIPGLLTNDTFFGFFKEEGKEKLVSGGRYRPLTPVLFALEVELFGLYPFPGHLFNVLYYCLLGVVFYFFMLRAFSRQFSAEKLPVFALIATLVFVAHPIHTEAVANIKGRDEIMAMLLGLAAMIALLKRPDTLLNKGIAFLLFYLALLSKENALMLIPGLGLLFFLLKGKSILSSLKGSLPFIAAGILYIIHRTIILGPGFGDPPLELMNNPFIKIEGGNYYFYSAAEKAMAIITNLGYYLKLLFIPYPLTNDYYPYQTGLPDISRPAMWFGLISYAALIFFAIKWWKNRAVVTYGIVFFLISILIYSNIFFPIGTNISERFLFMPSLGFSVVMAYGFVFLKKYVNPSVFYISVLILLILYSFTTVNRNFTWKNNFSLYTTDVIVSSESAKALNAAGGVLADASVKEENKSKKNEMLQAAEEYLTKAVNIHPKYKNAWLLLGNVGFYKKEYDNAIRSYEKALIIDPSYREANVNLALVLQVAGREAGELKGDLKKAKILLERSYMLNPSDAETLRLLGVAEGMGGNHEGALHYFHEMVKENPDETAGYILLTQTYRYLGNLERSNYYREKALDIDSNAFNEK